MDARPSQALEDRVPPHSQEAEQAVLGAMLLDREAVAAATTLLEKSDFYHQHHQSIFEAMGYLFGRAEPVDQLAVSQRLSDAGELEKVGGMPYLIMLMDSCPTSANIEHYVRIVREKAILRGLMFAGHKITAIANETEREAEEVVDEAERLVFSVAERPLGSSFTPLRQLVTETYDAMEDMTRERAPGVGVRTGFREIDQITSGLNPSELVILAGRPSMGKTALALNIAVRAARQEQVPVAVFSLEMSKQHLAMRLLCSEARVPLHAFRSGFPMDREESLKRLMHATEILYDAPIWIDDTPDLSVLALRGRSRRLKAEVGDLGLIIVDYLQLMRGHGRLENRQQEISQIARGLKSLAKELNVPIMALSQLSRKVEERIPRRPMLSDLRESGSIEAEADVVLFIYRPGYYSEEELRRAGHPETDQTVTEIIVAKQRNGPTGTVRLAWLGDYIRFERREEQRAAEEI
jgi:replicative DNA helicase